MAERAPFSEHTYRNDVHGSLAAMGTDSLKGGVMKFTMKLELDNAAFDDPGELSRILRQASGDDYREAAI